MARGAERTCGVSYLRVSTVEQAEKELSLTAQRRAITDFATRHCSAVYNVSVPLRVPSSSGTSEGSLTRAVRARFELMATPFREASTVLPASRDALRSSGTHSRRCLHLAPRLPCLDCGKLRVRGEWVGRVGAQEPAQHCCRDSAALWRTARRGSHRPGALCPSRNSRKAGSGWATALDAFFDSRCPAVHGGPPETVRASTRSTASTPL